MSSLRDKCSVCMDDLIVRGIWNEELATLVSTPCGHVFHGACFRNWNQQSNPGNRCPLCCLEMDLIEAVPVMPSQPQPEVTGNQTEQQEAQKANSWMLVASVTFLAIVILMVYIWKNCQDRLIQRDEQLQVCRENVSQILEKLRIIKLKLAKFRVQPYLDDMVKLVDKK